MATDIYGSSTRKYKMPDDFHVTDDHRAYCTEKWNLPYLADMFLEDFRECFEMNGRKHSNWDLTFKNYLRNSSPNGRFYNSRYWQNKCEQARRREIPVERKREPVPYHPQEIYTPVKIKTAYDHLANMRKILSQ